MIFGLQRIPTIIAGGIILALAILAFLFHAESWHWQKKNDQTQLAFDAFKRDVDAKTAIAKSGNLTDVRTTETKSADIVKGSQNDLEKQLADARAAGAAYGMRRCATQANSGSGGKASLPETAGPAESADGPGGLPIMDDPDVQACSAAVVKARGWQDFYGKVQATVNATGSP